MAIRGLIERVITIAEITCSTPNGVMAIRGGVDLRRSGRRQRAQRLTASWRFAGWRSASNPILHIGAQRLTASWRFADAWREYLSLVPDMCSTPNGVMAIRGPATHRRKKSV